MTQQKAGWGAGNNATAVYLSLEQTFFVTVDQMERMECSYVCKVLHFLLRERYGTPLVKLSVDVVDVENEASLDLLFALFKHCKCYERIVMHICTDHPLWFNVSIMS